MNPDYRSLATLTTRLLVALAACVVIDVIVVWSDGQELALLRELLDGRDVSDARLDANDRRQGILAAVDAVVFLAAAGLLMAWTYRASHNARALGAVDMRIRAKWAVGWYFIPVFNLWKPFQALKEIFQASHPEYTDNWKDAPPPMLLPVWWVLSLASTSAASLSMRIGARAQTADIYVQSAWVAFLGDLLFIFRDIALIIIVLKLRNMQEQKYRAISAQQ